MFERTSAIPYAIRQFCKCVYQMTIDRFGGQTVGFEKAIEVVAHFLLGEWLLKACFTNLHIEGLTKEFYLGAYCRKNLQLTKDILMSIMTFKNWEVPTPKSERYATPGEEQRDLFTIASDKKKKQRIQVEAFYKDLLQLDYQKKAQNVIQDESIVRSEKNKFPWFMMLICLDDVKMMLEFFRNHVGTTRGIKVLLERMDDVKELAVDVDINDFQNVNLQTAGSNQMSPTGLDDDVMAGCGVDPLSGLDPDGGNVLHRNSVILTEHFKNKNNSSPGPRSVNYMLFCKEPGRVEDKQIRAEKLKLMALDSAEEQQMRDHINLLLKDVEPLTRVKMTINDPNSLSEIMSVIRQHTEKKKAFGDQDFINKILQNSIASFFGRGSQSTQVETRESFHRFIKKFIDDQMQYMSSLQMTLFKYIYGLKSQEKNMHDRIILTA